MNICAIFSTSSNFGRIADVDPLRDRPLLEIEIADALFSRRRTDRSSCAVIPAPEEMGRHSQHAAVVRPASPRLLVMTSRATVPPSLAAGRRSRGCEISPMLPASSATSSRTFLEYALVPTARFSDFWNFAVAIICMVLVIFLMFRTALRRFTIARALAIGAKLDTKSEGASSESAKHSLPTKSCLTLLIVALTSAHIKGQLIFSTFGKRGNQ